MKGKRQVLFLTQAAVIAALYAALTAAQELLLPGTTSMAVQFRASEALMLLCVVTPAAIPGLTLGCFISNLLVLQVLPLDMVLGSLATMLAGLAMYALRNRRVKNRPLLAALMPAIFNGVIIGLEIEIFFIEGPFHFVSFLTQAGLVAAGELAVCFTLGLLLLRVAERPQVRRHLQLNG